MAIIDDVRSVIAKSLNLPIERLTPESRLDELGAESLDIIEIVYALEEKFDISIPFRADEGTNLAMPDKADGGHVEFSTIGDVAKSVSRLVGAKASQ